MQDAEPKYNAGIIISRTSMVVETGILYRHVLFKHSITSLSTGTIQKQQPSLAKLRASYGLHTELTLQKESTGTGRSRKD